MILRELLYTGLKALHSRGTRGTHKGPIKIFIKLYKKWTTFDKNYQKDNLWESFLLVRTID